MPDNSFGFSLPEQIEQGVDREIDRWREQNLVRRIWQKDAAVWTDGGEEKWLGWLDIAERELSDLEKYRGLGSGIGSVGFTDIVLLGMGGSSLCPEVLALSFGVNSFRILDSTVPTQVRTLESKLDLTNTLFIVASKSGSTLEPNCFMQYFLDRVSKAVGPENAGSHFIAITDPGSKMELAARRAGFRQIIFGEPTVGGRFSALSPFGMTAAAAMGLDAERLLEGAASMAAECRKDDPRSNPGALLGLILGVCHAAGRDKLTIFTSPEICDLGAWLEQLIAESTGKQGVAIIPVDREPLQPAVSYGADRVFVNIKLEGGSDRLADLGELRAAGHPVIEIALNHKYDLGAEFFRWEFATAAAGAVMGINPFDQPDVEATKIEARKITDEYARTGSLPGEEPFFESDGLLFFSSKEYASMLCEMVDEMKPGEILSAHFANVGEGDYFAILAYLEMNTRNETLLQRLRRTVLETRLSATCLGFGPRFLHSTGQAYKGGPNTGVFLQVTSDDAEDIAIPGENFSFGVVKAAQARGDLQVLLDRERRALRVHLDENVEMGLERLLNLV